MIMSQNGPKRTDIVWPAVRLHVTGKASHSDLFCVALLTNASRGFQFKAVIRRTRRIIRCSVVYLLLFWAYDDEVCGLRKCCGLRSAATFRKSAFFIVHATKQLATRTELIRDIILTLLHKICHRMEIFWLLICLRESPPLRPFLIYSCVN